MYLRMELKLSVLDAMGYPSVINQVFSLAGIDLAATRIISRVFSIFKKMSAERS